ncbi:hypothetical protein TNCV_4223911 [Trichonephila clavipes]|nr:hypothetical protein TNCV_4223911 [Trichonephila clavipes]
MASEFSRHESNRASLDALGREVAGRQPPPQTLQELERALHPNSRQSVLSDKLEGGTRQEDVLFLLETQSGTLQLFEILKSTCEIIRERLVSQCPSYIWNEPGWYISPVQAQFVKSRDGGELESLVPSRTIKS